MMVSMSDNIIEYKVSKMHRIKKPITRICSPFARELILGKTKRNHSKPCIMP